MTDNRLSYDFRLTIPSLTAGLVIYMVVHVGLVSFDSSSMRLYCSVSLRVVNSRI